eukprot:CAMPEP_0170308400 /NCGR_PEP_ID=MMETSP0116_2-20130129/54640_1 /TAXON_ID=400756 /ORGANISM="Durinskia baltica, Strain CSIRO CS-38" /LENGTH=58 /DNA_ID=CAMNT_0010560583 /DNA_START=1 /DNA_END=174 /DNA_ORIENTATION=+
MLNDGHTGGAPQRRRMPTDYVVGAQLAVPTQRLRLKTCTPRRSRRQHNVDWPPTITSL